METTRGFKVWRLEFSRNEKKNMETTRGFKVGHLEFSRTDK